MSESNQVNLNKAIGEYIHRISGLQKGSNKLKIHTKSGGTLTMLHYQDCCESVALEDFEDDITSHEGALITGGHIMTNEEMSLLEFEEHADSESYTWTFYQIDTNRGSLWLRWLGESNGYYSEEVDIEWNTRAD